MLIQDAVAEQVGAPVYPLPLSACRISRPYLLERAGIPQDGTALFFAIPYLIAADAYAPERNLSLYAVPRDYHLYVQELAARVLPTLREAFPGTPFALFSDHSPLYEGEAAAKAGLGVLGRNRMLITPEYGSFIFIAEVIVGADYETVTGHAPRAVPDAPPTCIGCGACQRACPVADRPEVNCLSALTQKKGSLTEAEAESLKQHPLVWGCDTCQLVCPLNREALSGQHDTPLPFFRDGRVLHLSAAELAEVDDTAPAFRSRTFSWRGKAPLVRNLALHEAEYTVEQNPHIGGK